ncbi:type II secretion system protein [bacterium]|nr:type II secretion system protein [bacterium]
MESFFDFRAPLVPICFTRRRGITLLEIIIAVGILAMAMIPVSGIMGYGAKAVSKDARQIEAIQLLEKTVNLLLQQPFKDIPVGNNITNYSTAPVNLCLGNIDGKKGGKYTVSMDCQIIPVTFSYQSVDVGDPTFDELNPPAGLFSNENLTVSDSIKEIKVKIEWTEEKTKQVQFRALTYRADLNRRGS